MIHQNDNVRICGPHLQGAVKWDQFMIHQMIVWIMRAHLQQEIDGTKNDMMDMGRDRIKKWHWKKGRDRTKNKGLDGIKNDME